MKSRSLFLIAFLAAGVWAGCGHRTLSIFFDGVPDPEAKRQAELQLKQDTVHAGRSGVSYREHGPFAAKMCDACHQRQTNVLTVPADRLCFQCHDIQLSKKYIHGPLASGGCMVCHDPHSSPYPSLLVSEPAGFCLQCHDAQEVAAAEGHRDVADLQCTVCHDAHMSDRKYLLK